MSKNILVVSTIHRMSERFLPVISDLKKIGMNVLIVNLGQSSANTAYQPNQRYLKKIDKILDKNSVYNGQEITDKRDVRSNSFCRAAVDLISEICRKNLIDTIILDDSRINALNYQIGKFCKTSNIFLFANSHGITDEPELSMSLKEPFYDKLLVFGRKESDQINLKYKAKLSEPVGIPENDSIKNAKKSSNQITFIVNRILSDNTISSRERQFDDKIAEQLRLVDLQELYNAPIVFKVKERMSENTKRDIEYLNKVLPACLNYEIVTHVDDEIEFLSKSKLVLSYGSGMNFKSMQMMIPTIIFRELGEVGIFEDYKGTINLNDDYFDVLDKIKNDDIAQFLKDNLEGSLDFSSTKTYRETIIQ